MVRDQTDGGRHPIDWVLPEDEIGAHHVIVAIADTIIEPESENRVHCPVCGDREPMQRAVTAHGDRFDRCVGCGLLWHVDYEAGVVIGARQVAPGARERP
jgi:hypothetical protein